MKAKVNAYMLYNIYKDPKLCVLMILILQYVISKVCNTVLKTNNFNFRQNKL